MFWSKKKEITSAEYADLLSKFMQLNAELQTLKVVTEKMELRIATHKRREKLEKEDGGDSNLTSEELESLRAFASQMGYRPQ